MTLSPWQLSVWSWDDKTSLKATVTRISGVTVSKALNAPYTFTITCTLSDIKAANIGRGMYVELSRARSGAKALWENGYIQTVTRNTANPMTLSLQCASPMWFLNEFRTLGNYQAGPGLGYTNVIDVLNGVGSPVTAPEHQGILPPGWTAAWIDQVNSPASSPAGLGDIWKGGWDTSWNSVSWILQHYNLFARESTSQTNYAYNGKLDIGPLGDASGLVIWGGAPLLADMQTNHGYVSATGRADLGAAQQLGYAVITNAQHQSDYQTIRNIVWIVGKAGHSIHNLAGGPPLDSAGAVQNGWSLLTLTHAGTTRPYYVKTATNYATYDGHVYSFVAAQGQTADAKTSPWDYGVMDITSANTYGPKEYTLEELKITDARMLLSAGLGCLGTWAQPVESFTFTVAHPLTSASGNPTRVAPGQTVAVHYSGQMPSIERDANGQWVASGQGTYTYLDYPGTADAGAVAKLKRVIQYDEEWSNGEFRQTLTLGSSKNKRAKGVNDALTKQLLRNRPGTHGRNHSFSKYTIDSIPFLCSNSPLAYDRQKEGALYINPGAIAVADIHHAQYFTDGHKVTFTVNVTDGTEYLDFWINKPIDNGTTLTPNPTPAGGATRSYLAFRLAFTAAANGNTNSAASCGFYSTTDGSTWTQRGTVPRSSALDSSRRLTAGVPYRITISWHGGKFEAHLSYADLKMPAGINQEKLIGIFNDKNPAIANNNWGTIGWMLHQGAAVAKITGLHAHPHHPVQPPKHSVQRGHHHQSHPVAKHRQQTTGSRGPIGGAVPS